MKKFLLPESGNYYKANLHSHSTVSDGARTPEELKALYKSKGYSIVAYTDHNVLIPHHELTDETFLALSGTELDVNNAEKTKTCHICYISIDPKNENTPLWHRGNKYLFGNAINYVDKVKFDESKPDYEREYSSLGISEMMRIGRDEGYFVTYNHPTWSYQDYSDYMGYDGMHAFEIVNGSCQTIGFHEYNPRVYDDILFGGKRLYCIASDDNHNKHPDDSMRSDSGHGFTVIKAKDLNYETITTALLDGHFYASEGPSIFDLYCEDGKLHVTTSDAVKIIFSCPRRHEKILFAEGGRLLNEGVFEIPESFLYFRITVIDKEGRHAITNAYFPEDI